MYAWHQQRLCPTSVAPSLTLDGFFLTRYHSCADSITIDMPQLVRDYGQDHISTSCCFFLNMRINLKMFSFVVCLHILFNCFHQQCHVQFSKEIKHQQCSFPFLTFTKVVTLICLTRKTIQSLTFLETGNGKCFGDVLESWGTFDLWSFKDQLAEGLWS